MEGVTLHTVYITSTLLHLLSSLLPPPRYHQWTQQVVPLLKLIGGEELLLQFLAALRRTSTCQPSRESQLPSLLR